jgi:hypothetical protein
MIGVNDDDASLDFAGIDALTPSFVDELLLVIYAVLRETDHRSAFRIVFNNVPTRLSEKFSAIARSHEASVEQLDEKTWCFTRQAAAVGS